MLDHQDLDLGKNVDKTIQNLLSKPPLHWLIKY